MSEEQTKTGAEVEQELLKEASQAPEVQASPEEVASQLLYIYTPIYENLVSGLSNKAMRRLLKKLVEYPLNDKEYASTTTQESQAFAIGTRLIEAKMVLQLGVFSQAVDQFQKQNEENKENNG